MKRSMQGWRAEHIEAVLHKHIGKSVLHLGDIEIDEDALIE